MPGGHVHLSCNCLHVTCETLLYICYTWCKCPFVTLTCQIEIQTTFLVVLNSEKSLFEKQKTKMLLLISCFFFPLLRFIYRIIDTVYRIYIVIMYVLCVHHVVYNAIWSIPNLKRNHFQFSWYLIYYYKFQFDKMFDVTVLSETGLFATFLGFTTTDLFIKFSKLWKKKRFSSPFL